MLIIALVLAVVGLAALVFAVVTSNALVAWVCIGASLLGVVLLIIDALRERRRVAVTAGGEPTASEASPKPAEAPEESAVEQDAAGGDVDDGVETVDAEYPPESPDEDDGDEHATDDEPDEPDEADAVDEDQQS